MKEYQPQQMNIVRFVVHGILCYDCVKHRRQRLHDHLSRVWKNYIDFQWDVLGGGGGGILKTSNGRFA